MEFIQEYRELAFWLTISSAALFLSSLVIIPFLLIRIPSDYFLDREKKGVKYRNIPKPLKLFIIILKNICGLILLFCGIAMLILPGQGILTIFLSVLLLDFPGKERFEYWLISMPGVLKIVNKMRKKAKCKPLQIRIKKNYE